MSQWARTSEGYMLLPTLGNGASAITSDPKTCAQIKIGAVLSFVKGEWAFDTSEGFPWTQIWGLKNPSIPAIKQLLRKTILGVELEVPVVSVDDLSSSFDKALRDFRYAAEATLANGQTVPVTGNSP